MIFSHLWRLKRKPVVVLCNVWLLSFFFLSFFLFFKACPLKRCTVQRASACSVKRGALHGAAAAAANTAANRHRCCSLWNHSRLRSQSRVTTPQQLSLDSRFLPAAHSLPVMIQAAWLYFVRLKQWLSFGFIWIWRDCRKRLGMRGNTWKVILLATKLN